MQVTVDGISLLGDTDFLIATESVVAYQMGFQVKLFPRNNTVKILITLEIPPHWGSQVDITLEYGNIREVCTFYGNGRTREFRLLYGPGNTLTSENKFHGFVL
jgi:hypothetical protein